MLSKFFNYISYLKYIAYLWGSYICFPEIYLRSENFISNVGLGLFLFGVAMSFESLKENHHFSKREEKLYSNPKKANRIIKFNMALFLYSIIVGVFFFNIITFFPHVDIQFAEKFKDLGFGSIGLGIGGLGMIKEQLNRFQSYQNNI